MLHPFFRGVPFDEVLSSAIDAPWIPELRSQRDTVFFEPYPESQESARKLSPDLDEQYFVDF